MKLTTLTMSLALILTAQQARAHCEIPCGIYDDEMRFDEMAEHITTIEKSMKEILALAPKAERSALEENQLVRWVNNKEAHAERLQHIVSQYFLHQRIKPAGKKQAAAYQRYIALLTGAHALLIDAMKAKQTVDLAVIQALRKDLETFRTAYFGKGHNAHGHH